MIEHIEVAEGKGRDVAYMYLRQTLDSKVDVTVFEKLRPRYSLEAHIRIHTGDLCEQNIEAFFVIGRWTTKGYI